MADPILLGLILMILVQNWLMLALELMIMAHDKVRVAMMLEW